MKPKRRTMRGCLLAVLALVVSTLLITVVLLLFLFRDATTVEWEVPSPDRLYVVQAIHNDAMLAEGSTGVSLLYTGPWPWGPEFNLFKRTGLMSYRDSIYVPGKESPLASAQWLDNATLLLEYAGCSDDPPRSRWGEVEIRYRDACHR